MSLAPVRRTSLVQEAVDAMRALLDSGEWQVGRQVPPEPELAEALGVSRSTVREAVGALAHVGVLEVRRGHGTFVVATTEVQAMMSQQVARHDDAHLLEVRQALETAAVALAARRRTEADLARLDEISARRRDAVRERDRRAFVDIDVELHLAVVASAHNPLLEAIYEGLAETLRASIDAQGAPDGFPHVLDDEHDAMIEAVRRGDADDAVAATTDLLHHLARR